MNEEVGVNDIHSDLPIKAVGTYETIDLLPNAELPKLMYFI